VEFLVYQLFDDIAHSVRHLILDEADRMLDAEFLEQVQEIIAACTHESLQKAVFSATLPANAEKIALGMMRNPIRIVVGLKYVLQPSIISIILMRLGSQKRYTASAHSTIPYLCCRRRFKVTDTPYLSLPTIQSSCSCLCIVAAPRIVPGRRTGFSRCIKCRLPPRRYDATTTRRCYLADAKGRELGNDYNGGHGTRNGL
jgi:hypothetical protein